MKNVMKRVLALTIVLVMLLTMIACAKDKDDTPTTDAEETTTAAPDDNAGDETPDDPDDGKDNGGNNGGNTGGNNGGNTGDDTPGDGGNSGDDEPNEPEEPEEPTPVIPEGKDFVLVKDGVAQFVIVTKNKAYGYDKMAENFQTALLGKTSAQFSLKKSASSSEKALYIGAEPSSFMSKSELAALTYDGYVIREINGHIHLTAYTKEGVQKALNALTDAITEETITMNGTKMSVTIPGSVVTVTNPEYAKAGATLLGKRLSNFVIVLPSNYTAIERFAAENLIAQIGHDTGVKLDYVKQGVTQSKPYRIVLGPDVLENVPKSGYLIKNDGTDLYVAYDNYLVTMEIAAGLSELYGENSAATVDASKTFDYSEQKLEKNSANVENPNKVVRIMTSNIVAPGDENGQEDIEKRYGVTWKERMQIQGRAIMAYLPDFIGFQELQQGKVNGVTALAHTELLSVIGEEYEFIYFDEIPKASYFTPIAYRKNVWNLEEKAVSDPTSPNHMHRWQWARFSLKADPTVQYILINLHYPISSMPAERVQAGTAVNAEFDRLKTLYPDVPISICGDFNADFGSDLFNLTIGATEDGIADTDLKTSYMATADKGASTASIDHILIENDDVTVLNYRVVGDEYIKKTSDHKPVIADIHIGKIIVPTPGPDIPWEDGVVQP